MLRRVSRSVVGAALACSTAVRFGSCRNKISCAEDAVSLIKNGSTLTCGGFVTFGCPEEILQALEKRFLETGEPRDLTVIFQGGPGDYGTKGLNRVAHKGMIKRTIGAHYGQVPAIGKMALDGLIDAYNFPMGCISRMIRCAATKQPYHITEIGMGTMIDPQHGGGRINTDKTKENIVKEIIIDGKRYLTYPAFPIDVAIIRATYADTDGNLAYTHEALYNENLLQAMAVRARRGLVIAQVERVVARDSLRSREVMIPGTMIDCIVEAKPENHTMGYFCGYDPAVTGEIRLPPGSGKPMPLNIRKMIARRASLELMPDMVVNLGIGVPEGVALVADEEQCLQYIELTTEPGIAGGVGLSGHNFGPARNYNALISMDHQFDFYNGGGLDICFLGNAETDRHGHVNVTRMGNKLTGPGGFIDITQSTQKVNLLGTFTAGDLQVEAKDGKLHIIKEGRIKKFVKDVREISFSGIRAREKKQCVTYITERCVFQLTDKGMELVEIAPGVDLQKNILDQMDFEPIIREPLRIMDERIFNDALMKLRHSNFGASMDISERVFLDKVNNIVFVDYYDCNYQTEEDIKRTETYLKEFICKHFPKEKKADVVQCFDSFDIHPDLVQDWVEVQKNLEPFYKSVKRLSTGVFRRHKAGQLMGIETTSGSETLGDVMGKDDVIHHFKLLGIASPDSVSNAYNELFDKAEHITRRDSMLITKRLTGK